MTFTLNNKELLDIQAWVIAHDAECHGSKRPYAGAAGGALAYEFTPTWIGTVVVVRCVCGETFNATDFDDW